MLQLIVFTSQPALLVRNTPGLEAGLMGTPVYMAPGQLRSGGERFGVPVCGSRCLLVLVLAHSALRVCVASVGVFFCGQVG